MIFERPSLFHQFGEKDCNTSNVARTKSLTSFRARDPSVPLLSDIGSRLSPQESSRRLQLIVDCARKVLIQEQVAIVVLVPHIVHWVTPTSEQALGRGGADDVTKIAEALESKLGGPNSELVAEHVVRASTRAQLGIQNRNTIELRASEKSYKVDLDCYFDDPDLHAIVALMTPLNDIHKTGYEEAQLSSMRYHVGILVSKQSDIHNQGHNLAEIRRNSMTIPAEQARRDYRQSPHQQSSENDSSEQKSQSSDESGNISWSNSYTAPTSGNFLNSISDFIPSISGREVEHFYAMLPGSSAFTYSDHENELASNRPIHEEEQMVGDPDNFDPHLRMRLLQQRSLSPVIPRRPRELAVVQAELEQEARLFAHGGALGPRQGTSSQKKNDVRCLQCGVDSSPEWRKGPMGPKTLCNRCGLRYAKKLRMSN